MRVSSRMAAPCRLTAAAGFPTYCWRVPVNTHPPHRCSPARMARTRCAAASSQQPNQDLPSAAAQLVDPAALAASAAAAIGAQSDVAVDEAANLFPTSTAAAATAGVDTTSSPRVQEPSGLPTEVIYSSLAAAFAAAGAAVSFLAPSLAAAAVAAGSSPPTAVVAAPVLLGCFGAHVVRLASMCWFLKGGVHHQELHTWRYQRVNLCVVSTCALTALLQLVYITRGPLLLTLPLLGLSLAAAGITGRIAQAHWQQGIVSPAGVGQELDWWASAALLWLGARRVVNTLAGGLAAPLCVVGLGCGLAAAVGLGAPAGEGLGALLYCRALAAVGLLGLGLQAGALFEPAGGQRRLEVIPAVEQVIMEKGVVEAQAAAAAAGQLPAPLVVPQQRFLALQLGLVVGLGVQAAWLLVGLPQAATGTPGLLLGPDVINSDPLVWGGLSWSLLLSCMYAVTIMASVTASDVAAAIAGAFAVVSGFFHWLAGAVLLDWVWVHGP